MTRQTFKAYDALGNPILITWTESPTAYELQKSVLQGRLNRFELSWVDVSSDDPQEKNYRKHAAGKSEVQK